MIIMTPEEAMKLRALAEMSRDPQLYRKAAAAFLELGMHAQADAMIRRAEWYEKGGTE